MLQQIDRLKVELREEKTNEEGKHVQLEKLRVELGLSNEQIKAISQCHNELAKSKKRANELQETLNRRKKYLERFSISALARRLSVDNVTIKSWSCRFSDYLSPSANPPKGNARLYSHADVKVLNYIAYWNETYAENYDESDWDEEIFDGLSRGEHLRIIPPQETSIFLNEFDDFAEFAVVWEEWDSAGIGGMADGAYDDVAVADAYKRAGDILAKSGEPVWDIIYPAIFNYRHSIELYIKIIVQKRGRKKGHNLEKLLTELNNYVVNHYNAELPEWFQDRILEFQRIDTESATAFRYADVGVKDEVVVMLPRLKQIMDFLQNAFHLLVKDFKENTTIHAQPQS